MSLRRDGTGLGNLADFVQDATSKSGGKMVTGTGAVTGVFGSFTALETTVIATLVSQIPGIWDNGSSTAVKVPAGCTIFGFFTSITLTSGSGIAYFRP